MRRIRLTFTALSAIALVAGISPHAASAAEEIAVVASDVLTADQKVFISKKGAEVVEHIGAAKKLAAGTSGAANAQREAGKALAILRGIEKVSPATRIHDAIDALLHKTHGKKAKPEDLLPVIGVLDEVGEVKGLGVEEARVSLNKAKDKLGKGMTVEAEADIIEASATVGYLEIDLPIHETKVRLMRRDRGARPERHGQRQRRARRRAEAQQVLRRDCVRHRGGRRRRGLERHGDAGSSRQRPRLASSSSSPVDDRRRYGASVTSISFATLLFESTDA